MATTTVTRIEQEPIINIKLIGNIAVDDVHYALDQAAALFPALNSADIYLVFDVTEGKSTFKDILQIVQFTAASSQQIVQGDAPMPLNVMTYFVGDDAMIKLYIDARRQQQYGSESSPLFAHVDDALAAIRQRATHNHDQNQTATV